MNPTDPTPATEWVAKSGGWIGFALTLVAGLAFTAVMVNTLNRVDSDLAAGIFEQRNQRAWERLHFRLGEIRALLAQAECFILKAPMPPTATDWDAWFGRQIRFEFPEIVLLGFGRVLPGETSEAQGLSGQRNDRLPFQLLATGGTNQPTSSSPGLTLGGDLLGQHSGTEDSGDVRATLQRAMATGTALVSGLIASSAPAVSQRTRHLSQLFHPVHPAVSNPDPESNRVGVLVATLDLSVLLDTALQPAGPGVTRVCHIQNDDRRWNLMGSAEPPVRVIPTHQGPGLTMTMIGEYFGRGIRCDFQGNPGPGGVRRGVWIAGILGVLVTGLFASLVWGLAWARQSETLTSSRLREAHGKLANVTRERDRLTRDLHDGTIQSIYAVGFDLQRVRNLIGRNPAGAAAELTHTMATLNNVVIELREFIQDAEPGPAAIQNVDTVLQALVKRTRLNTHAQILLELSPDAAQLVPPRQAVEVLQIVREALTNSLRHGYPRQIGIALTRDGNDWRLTIADDGSGFDPQLINGRDGHGLRNLHERAAELGGECIIVSAPGTGTAVRVIFPVLVTGTVSHPAGGEA